MGNALVKSDDKGAILERVVVQGDLSQLTPQERAAYYLKVCESLGLNPLTKPFEYLLLKDRDTKEDKLILYATRACTDQLRDKHKISIEITEAAERDGLYQVTAKATTPDGRVDVDVGAVSLEREQGEWKTANSGKRYFSGNGKFDPLRGDARANAIMKALTKAKRRVTLSVCGLGWLDESEVETIPDARIGEPDKPAPPESPRSPAVSKPSGSQLPANGLELRQRLGTYDAKLAAEKISKPGELLTHVARSGTDQGWSDDLSTWDDPDQIAFAAAETRRFEAACRAQLKQGTVTVNPNDPSERDPDGVRLYNRVRELGIQLHADGCCANEDDLLHHLRECGAQADPPFPRDITEWRGDQIRQGWVAAQAWVAAQRKRQPQPA